ncbi:MAG: 50S ribosomal protein L30 [Gammaproteobacteria bacterium]|nr:50S ribosomal protein L30 [Gammaproteobacteria bacterium]
MSKINELNVTLVRSLSKCLEKHKACVKGLGIKRINRPVTVMDTPENRGMINKVAYLLKVEEK